VDFLAKLYLAILSTVVANIILSIIGAGFLLAATGLATARKKT